MVLDKIYVDDKNPLYVFRGIPQEKIYQAFDYPGERMSAVLESGSASGRSYAVTFVYKEVPFAPSQFSLTAQTVVIPTIVGDEDGCPAEIPQASATLTSQ